MQISTQSSELGISTVEAPTATDSISLIDLIVKGGIIMLPIFILSFIAVFVIAERVLAIRKANKNSANILPQVKSYLQSGDIKAAQNTALSAQNTSLGRMIYSGVKKIGSPIKQIETAMEATGKVEVMKLEKNLTILGIVAAVAPMMGFVGTISGVIKIFYNISLADNISIGLIAGGLYEKMITSAAGLIVGIIAHTGYHIINFMIEKIVLEMETAAFEIIDQLES
ncbi:MAG: MotA/TolQ/ExbB proton channel family protein [Cytophagales bacterium]|nr:MotA/TolQ/ExbB proton channel family protein [Cytophagales bacterium]